MKTAHVCTPALSWWERTLLLTTCGRFFKILYSTSWHNIHHWSISFEDSYGGYRMHPKKMVAITFCWLTNPPWSSLAPIHLKKNTVFTAVWSCGGFVHGHQKRCKICQSYGWTVWSGHTIAFVVNCEQMQNWEHWASHRSVVSTISLTFSHRSASTISWIFSIVSSVQTSTTRSERSASAVLMQSQRNSVYSFY